MTASSKAGLESRLRSLADTRGDRVAFRVLRDMDPSSAHDDMTFAGFVSGLFRTADLLTAITSDARPVVALMVPNTAHGQLSLFAAELAGMALPLNNLLPEHHVRHLLQSAGATVLVVDGAAAHDLALARYGTIVDHILSLDGLVGATAGSAGRRRDRHDAPDGIVAAFHTGGTTGAPKLALHRERNQLAVALGCAARTGMVAEDVVLNPFPLFHVGGAFCIGLAAILSGACQLLPTRDGARSAGFRDNFWPIVGRHAVTMISGVPTIIGAAAAQLPPVRPPSLRRVIVGGAPLPLTVERDLLDRWALPVSSIYGMTETAGLIAARDAGERHAPGWIGPAAPGVEIRIVADPRDAASGVQPLVRGHVLVCGATVGPGYLDLAMNAALFTDSGWLVTGDIGMLDPVGNLMLTGRAKDIIIRGGHNIEAALIEEAAASHPAVEVAAAVAAPDRYAGELPYLYVQLKPQHAATPLDIEQAIRTRVEGPAVPKHIVILDRLPATGAGKVYKPALRAMAACHVMHAILRPLGLDDATWRVEDVDGRIVVRLNGETPPAVVTIAEELGMEIEPSPGR